MLTRRAALSLGLSIPAFAASDFWNDKDPALWSAKEAERLLNNSPWARETAVAPDAPGADGSYTDAGRAGVARSPSSTAGMRGGGPPTAVGEDSTQRQPPVRVLVRWDSATPMRQAARKPVPPLASQYYIITMSGLPMGSDSEGGETRRHVEDQLQGTTQLLRKGKDPIYPERLQVIDNEGRRTVVFLFSRTPEPITPEDKEVIFLSALGSLRFKIRFALKEMIYRGKLDL